MKNDKSITPLPPADFTPEYETPVTLTPFRFFCQKVLPTVYDDSLSYYELLCKFVGYINDVVNNNETLQENVLNLHKAYVLLQTYVNDYFKNLDVQQEINNKLDEMSANGDFLDLFGNTKLFVDNSGIVKNSFNNESFFTNGEQYDVGYLSDFLSAQTESETESLYIASVNIENEGLNVYRTHCDITQHLNTCELLYRYPLTFLGCQEIYFNVLSSVIDQFPVGLNNVKIGNKIANGDVVGTLANFSKYSIISSEEIFFSQQGSTQHPIEKQSYIITKTDKLTLINTHIWYGDKATRKAQLQELNRKARELINKGETIVLVGDFNILASESTELYADLTNSTPLKPATLLPSIGSNPADNVVYDSSKFNMLNVEIIDNPYSDHKIVLSKLEVK